MEGGGGGGEWGGCGREWGDGMVMAVMAGERRAGRRRRRGTRRLRRESGWGIVVTEFGVVVETRGASKWQHMDWVDLMLSPHPTRVGCGLAYRVFRLAKVLRM